MMVAIPVRSAEMYLNISDPKLTADAYLGIEEVWPRPKIVKAGINNFDRLCRLTSVGCCVKLAKRKHTMLPDVMQ